MGGGGSSREGWGSAEATEMITNVLHHSQDWRREPQRGGGPVEGDMRLLAKEPQNCHQVYTGALSKASLV